MNRSSTVTIAKSLLIPLGVIAGCGRVERRQPTNELLPIAAMSKANATPVSRRELSDGVITDVRGLRVVAPSRDDDDARAFNWNAGTSVAVGISLPAGGIIGLDRDASQITAFQDNHGTDLWDGPKASRFSQSRLDMMPQIAEDARTILFDVDGQGVPQPGASSLTLKGVVQLWVASQKTTFSTKDVTLDKGTSFQIGPRTIQVTKTGMPAYGNQESFSATLRLLGETTDIANVSFFDAQGHNLSARRQSSFWSGAGESRVNHWEFVFTERPVAPVNVVLTQWTDLKKQTVPLDLRFGVGF